MKLTREARAGQSGLFARAFALSFGAFLGLALLKFGNPPLMEKWASSPGNIYEFILSSPWPILWGYLLLGVMVVAGFFAADWKTGPAPWLAALPLAWLTWECLAAALTVSSSHSMPTLAHFFACVACFYVGFFCLADIRRSALLPPGMLCAFLIVLAAGWQQHFGGLDDTRRYFFLYIYPRLKEVPPDYLKKITSTRIFSTLFYPNALAGAVLLFLPVLLQFIWQARKTFTAPARVFIVAAVAVGALGCLFWSGSKGGWLLALVLGLIWLMRLPFNSRIKQGLIAIVLVAGLAGFFLRYAGFFHKGATSVGARFDYWQAAARTAISHPLVGTGPGTFSIAYQRIKRPESEMARLVHNDYLEQASDSGLPGLLFYSVFIIGVLVVTAPRLGAVVQKNASSDSQKSKPAGTADRSGANRWGNREPLFGFDSSLAFAFWTGLLGWALQGLMEFGLYMPALAWPAFTFMGLLLGSSRKPVEG